MIQEVKTYWCDGIPTDEDIRQAIEIVRRDCSLIKLQCFDKSGYETAMIAYNSTIESTKAQMPTYYPTQERREK